VIKQLFLFFIFQTCAMDKLQLFISLVLTNQYGFSIQLIFKFFISLRAKLWAFASEKEKEADINDSQ